MMQNATETPHPIADMVHAAARSAHAMLTLPFDMARDNYAQAVKAGLIEDSLIACARHARQLNGSELLALGPWARQR